VTGKGCGNEIGHRLEEAAVGGSSGITLSTGRGGKDDLGQMMREIEARIVHPYRSTATERGRDEALT
jgi:hypothetical protein